MIEVPVPEIQAAIAKLSNEELTNLENQVKRARNISRARLTALDRLSVALRRDRLWREQGTEV